MVESLSNMIILIPLVLILIGEIIFYVYYIDNNKKETITYYRDIPSNESPAIVGYMVKENIDGNDIIALILDLWKKEYITVEYRKIDNREQCIIKDTGKDRFMILKDFENYLLDELFKDKKEVVLEEFVSSPKFEMVFKNVGNMIRRRANLKKTHRISYKRLTNKINFLINFIVLGFSIFFPIIYLITHKFLMSVLIGYFINIVVFLLVKKLLVKDKQGTEGLLFGISSVISIVYLSMLVILYLVSSYTYQFNYYFEISNIVISVLLLFSLLIGDYDNKMRLSLIDYIILIYSVVSIVISNLIGICICIIYYSYRLYLKSRKHSYYSDTSEIDKWIALKQFLNDFSNIKDRDLLEIKIWDKYLIYGIAMGVSKKSVLKSAELSNIKLVNESILEKCYSENISF